MKTTRHCKGGPFAVQGRTQMPMGSNRFRSSPRKRSNVKNENDASDIAILNVAVDSESLFRRRVPSSLSGKRNRAVDDVFHTLLCEANRELASLLQYVRTKAGGPPLGAPRSQQLSQLLIPAARCSA